MKERLADLTALQDTMQKTLDDLKAENITSSEAVSVTIHFISWASSPKQSFWLLFCFGFLLENWNCFVN